MKVTNEAISVAHQFDRLYASVMRELRKRHPGGQRIEQLKRDAARVSTRLRRLMGW